MDLVVTKSNVILGVFINCKKSIMGLNLPGLQSDTWRFDEWKLSVRIALTGTGELRTVPALSPTRALQLPMP